MEQVTCGPDGGTVPVPVQLCECGCGSAAPIARYSHKRRGYVKGQPLRFVVGHYAKLAAAAQRAAEVPAESRPCECGCGQPAPIVKMTERPKGRVKGQPGRFVAGHQFRNKTWDRTEARRLAVEPGQKIGKSVVVVPEIPFREADGAAARGVRLRCGCGTEYVRRIEVVFRNPEGASCGCAMTDDFTGQRFGKLVAVRWVVSGADSQVRKGRWLCRCDCGNEISLTAGELRRTRGCGCGRRGPRAGRAANQAGIDAVLRLYKKAAQNRGLVWELTDGEFLGLTALDCHYCGTVPATVTRKFVYNGVDRVDNARGYTLDNVVTACKMCNRAKMDMPYEDFLEWIARIAAFHFFRPDLTPPELLKTRA